MSPAMKPGKVQAQGSAGCQLGSRAPGIPQGNWLWTAGGRGEHKELALEAPVCTRPNLSSQA